MINTSRKWLKVFLVLDIKKLGLSVAPIFGIYVKFLNFLFLDKFTTIPLALLSTLITSLSLALNTFAAESNDPVAFNSKISSAAILLKP